MQVLVQKVSDFQL